MAHYINSRARRPRSEIFATMFDSDVLQCKRKLEIGKMGEAFEPASVHAFFQKVI
jgi:hypothetical protein